jgi:hypothetical protein
MKKKYRLICIILVFCNVSFLVYSQEVNNRKYNPDESLFITPKNHDPNFSGYKKGSTKSFYQSKSEWQHIIDTTWGPGDSLARKLLIFNSYANTIRDKGDGLKSLHLDWDSLYNHYLSQITESTSKGAFSSILSHLAYDMKNGHVLAYDSKVISTPLNPGVPLLLIGFYHTFEHFGAVTTILPDSTTLVLRVLPDHPLNLEPGDIILGYEGIPWKDIVPELLDAGLPMLANTGGCKTADTYNNLLGAGLNWHLFSTMDIIKYSSGDTLHLSVLPMADFKADPMVNNEQLAIKNIPFPSVLPYPVGGKTQVTGGKLENTNIGYVYIAYEYPEGVADAQFFKIMDSLKNTDGLIIDMRLNFGGWDMFPKTFGVLFNESFKTIDEALRCNPKTLELCPTGNSGQFQINGLPQGYYDRPIAVLLGPSCISMGDMTAQRLRYHPMVRFFGASPVATLGASQTIDIFPGYLLRNSIYNMFHTSEPGVYLNGKEFPVDYPVWFNKDDVAAGKDPIVEKSLEWINNLAYGHAVSTDKWLYSAGDDTVKINATIENPNSHQLSAQVFIESLDGYVIDSVDMTEFNLSEADYWQAQWITPGTIDKIYWISLKVTDNTDGTSFTNKHAVRITTVSPEPLLIDSLPYVALTNSRYSFKPYLKNAGTSKTINKIKVNLTCSDPWVKSISPAEKDCSNLIPGRRSAITGPFTLTYDPEIAPNPLKFNLTFNIASDYWPYWVIDTTVIVNLLDVEPEKSSPSAFSLSQNYPNPFNSITTIGYGIKERSNVKIKVLNAIGKEVAIVMNAEKEAGNHDVEFNAGNLPGGVYYYQIKAGGFIQTKKMIVLK